MPLIEARTDGTTVILRFDTQGVPAMWLNLLNGGDLAAFAVDSEASSGTPEASPASSPVTLAPVDESIWLACPDYDGPHTYASREGVTSDVAPPSAFDPRPGRATIHPCDYPGPEPDVGNPVPLN